ncbi:MAG: hypothetical protein ABIQ18_46820 [Umezawaea sp.]
MTNDTAHSAQVIDYTGHRDVLPWAAVLVVLAVLGLLVVVRGVRYRALLAAYAARRARGALGRTVRVLILAALIGGAQYLALDHVTGWSARAAVLAVPALLAAVLLSRWGSATRARHTNHLLLHALKGERR